MNNGICDKTSNNKYFDCPPRMDDGRHFTDYRPNCYVNDLVRYNNKVMSSYEYRQFLINNGNKLRKINNQYNNQKNGCKPCNAQAIGTETKCVNNKSYSTCYPDDCNGLGLRNVYGHIPNIDYSPGLQQKKEGFSQQINAIREPKYVDYDDLYPRQRGSGSVATPTDIKFGSLFS